MPDIAWLFEYPTANGGERSLLATLPVLRERGFHITTIAPPAGPLADALRAAEVEIIPLDLHEGGRASSLAARHEALADVLRPRRVDLLHANSLAMGRLAGPVAAALGLPSIAHLRDIVRLSAAAIDDLGCNNRLLAVSTAARDYHIAQGLAADKVEVLFNGVDLTRFRPAAPTGWLHQELKLTPDRWLFGAIGQLVLRKGHDVLAASATRLASILPQAHWVIVGERYSAKAEALAHLADVRAAFERAGLGDRVHFLGRREDVHRILPELRLLVHPSRQEPLGRVLLEAAASGTPIVATDVGGTREIFPTASAAARLVPPDDPAALAQAIHALALDNDARVALGNAARRRAVEAFDARDAADGLARHYSEVITAPALSEGSTIGTALESVR